MPKYVAFLRAINVGGHTVKMDHLRGLFEDHWMRKHITLLILPALAGAGIAWWCMSSGVGISPDSVIYLSAADSFSVGKGLKPIASHFFPNVSAGEPLVSFPPVYPLLLSLSNMVNGNQLSGVRYLHSLLFAANIFLVGLIVYLATARSALASLVGTLLFVSSPRILEIHAMAWSEPPFILFILLAAFLLMRHFATPHYLLLVGASLSAGLAITTRYAGVTILPPMIITILFFDRGSLKTRIRDCLMILGIGIFPLAVWLLRNRIVAGSATHRSLAFHPLEISEFNGIVNSLLAFWVPFPVSVYLKMVFLFFGGALVLAGIVLAFKNRRREQSEKINAGMQMFAAVFITTYLLFLCTYNSLMNPLVDLLPRVLSPVYAPGIILLICVAYKLSRLGNRNTLWWGFIVLSSVLISVNAKHAISSAAERHNEGSGYGSRAWAGSKSIEYLKTSADFRTTYSNGIDAIYFLTRRNALRIPARVDLATGKNYSDFEQEIDYVRNELLQKRAVVVYLDRITGRGYLPTKDELTNIYKLPVLIQLDDGTIFGVK